ncbi:asparagine synthase (glutamine-hydrolyzing), partial [Lecanoromycetidae sp. Uapishka_2]
MCGSIAIVVLDQQSQRQTLRRDTEVSKRLDAGLSQIKHRGPDAQGQWISSDKHTVHAIVNGEIYDYDRLRADMVEKQGYKFQGRSDCELVLALYQYYGKSFVSYLRGEFALCLYDSERELFLAIRDRYGIKPLFWTIVDGELLVAAEMKALKPLGWKPEWNVKAIVDASFQIGPTTIFKNVQKVQPGHMLISRHFAPVVEQQYWEMDYPYKLVRELRTENEMIDGVRSRLLDAIRVRLRADVKVGVALSGGIDSSVVAGMVNHLIREGEQVGSDAITERLSCFGIAFDEDSGFDESADFLGVKFYKKHMDEQALADCFEDATWLDEQPNPDLNFVGLYALSGLVRKHGFRVILNGQGSDEIFAGYPLFMEDYLREADHSCPAPNTPDSSHKAGESKAENESKQLTVPTSARRMLADTLAPALMTSAFPNLPFRCSVIPHKRSSIPDPQLSYAEALSPMILERMKDKWHPLHTAEYIFCKTHLENLILSNLGDRGEMAHSIEGRTPFLDHHLTEYANGLPPSMKIRPVTSIETQEDNFTTNGTTPNGFTKSSEKYEFVEKFVLREAARPFITDEIYKKRKHPYSAPLQYPVNGPLHRLMKKLITKENIADLGFLEWIPVSHELGDGKKSLKDLVDIAFEEKEKSTFKLVICLAQWVILGQRFGVQTVNTSLFCKCSDGE